MEINVDALVNSLTDLAKNLGLVILDRQSFLRTAPMSQNVLVSFFAQYHPSVIFDVGAHHGESASFYLHQFPVAEVHAFEPFTGSFEKLNRLQNARLKKYNLGLSDREGTEAFNLNAGTATNSLLSLDTKAKETWEGISELTEHGREDCQFTTLDTFCERHGISQISLLKIDVQGAEYKVLAGASSALRAQTIDLIQLEVISGPTYEGQKSFNFYLSLLGENGYKLYAVADISAKPSGELKQLDAFFIRE